MTRRREQRGAAIVEGALIFPLLALLTLGVIDGGLYFAARASTGNATRDAARAIAVAGTSKSADYDGLRAMKKSLNGLVTGEVERIVVFDAGSYSPDVPAPCAVGPSKPGADCNVYVASDLNRPESDFYNEVWRGPKGWTASERSSSRTLGADLVGVAVTSRLLSPIGILGGTDRRITRVVVVQMEVNEL